MHEIYLAMKLFIHFPPLFLVIDIGRVILKMPLQSQGLNSRSYKFSLTILVLIASSPIPGACCQPHFLSPFSKFL